MLHHACGRVKGERHAGIAPPGPQTVMPSSGPPRGVLSPAFPAPEPFPRDPMLPRHLASRREDRGAFEDIWMPEESTPAAGCHRCRAIVSAGSVDGQAAFVVSSSAPCPLSSRPRFPPAGRICSSAVWGAGSSRARESGRHTVSASRSAPAPTASCGAVLTDSAAGSRRRRRAGWSSRVTRAPDDPASRHTNVHAPRELDFALSSRTRPP